MTCKECIIAKEDNEVYHCPFDSVWSYKAEDECCRPAYYLAIVKELRKRFPIYQSVIEALYENDN